MAHVQIESLVDLRQKNVLFHRYRGTIALATVLVGTTILGMFFISGLSHNTPLLSIEPPMRTAISVRPDFPVSTYLENRGAFSWFIGVAATVLTVGLAFAALGPGCVAVTAGIAIAGCAMAAVSAALAIVGSIQAGMTTRKLSIAQSSMVYMDYVDKSSKRSTIDPPSSELEFDHDQFLNSVFGSDYTFAGMITKNSTHNRHLVERNNGTDLPVFSFTTPQGIKLHHVFIDNQEEGTRFHRFGFQSGASTGKRQAVADTDEYFTSGGIDALDCAADDTNTLNINDQDQMQTELLCAVPDFNSTGEIAVQIYDATTQETIAAGRVAPVAADGTSVITQSAYTTCPDALTTGDNCGDQSATD